MPENEKWVQKGEMTLRGKVLKLALGDPEDPNPIRLFCMVEDVRKLLNSTSAWSYVRLFLDAPGEGSNG